MPFRELVSTSLTDQFVKEIEGLILSGELKPGDRLPTERELASTMNVSVAVVNGGVKRLASLGFLHIAPRKGVYVADYYRDGSIATLEEILDYSEENLNADIMDAIIEYRRSVEGKATEYACNHCKDECLKRMQKFIQAFENNNSLNHLAELAYEFHHETGVGCGNIVYALMIATFKRIYIVSYKMMIKANGKDVYLKYFKETLKALQSHDSKRVMELFEESISRWKETLDRDYHLGLSERQH